jgi:ABC-2 type transport system ATP-binding protein
MIAGAPGAGTKERRPVIAVEDLTKVYRVPVKEPGLWASVRSIWNRRYKEVRAVDKVSFTIEAGERIGFLGPNGAGKTTTLKMLTGLLHPTSGTCRVAGFRPQDRDSRFLRTITLVMGQKQQLLWDLPASETFSLNRALFDIPHAQFRESLKELTALLDLANFVDQPVRNLSLGQRMRAELAAALLHRPKVLFLDEPTIGMDVEVQALVRQFVIEYNRRYGATVMLTSHDMADVAQLARRILLIDQGVVRFDGTLEALQRRFSFGRQLLVRGPEAVLAPLGFRRVEEDRDGRFVATVDAERVNGLLAEVLRQLPTADVTVADPPLEEVLRAAFGDLRGTRPAAEITAPALPA